MIVAMAGLPGTGKTAIARQLAVQLPGILLDKDEIRAALFPSAEIEYTTAQDDFCLRIMVQVSEYILLRNPSKAVILDGRPFAKRYQVDELVAAAARLSVPLKIIECVCSDHVAEHRLARDVAQQAHKATNRGFELYLSLKAQVDPINESRLVIDTSDTPLRECVMFALDYVRGGAHRGTVTGPQPAGVRS